MNDDRTAAYEAVIGLEIHAQLKTRSKMFCGCAVEFEAAPNTRVCPVCLGHPGALPVANERAVALGVRLALAVGAEVHPRSGWARKNYFYPDLPKGYQITQFRDPLATGGEIEIEGANGPRRIGITRLHLEEDAGRSKHPERPGERRTRIDLNRCGTPLLEIVSAPDLRTPHECYHYLSELKQILQYCHVCDGEMEKGQLRCDANLSVRRRGSATLETKTEIKNLNSFRNAERALTAEFTRQVKLREEGRPIEQATLLWDQLAGTTRLMRGKEEAHDYRYFPEPDLPPLQLKTAWIERVRRNLPELPAPRRRRLVRTFGIRPYDAALLTAARDLGDYFEAVAGRVADAQAAANLIGSHLLGALKECGCTIGACPVPPDGLVELLDLQAEGTLSSRLTKQVLDLMMATGKRAADLVTERGWVQTTNETQLTAWATQVVEHHAAEAAAYRAGKRTLLKFFVGQVMKRSQGIAHPEKVREVLTRILEDRS